MAGPPTVTFSSPEAVVGGWFTNTAYTYSIITTGDPNKFATDKFHVTGDWYTLSITGLHADGTTAGPVNIDLADYFGASLKHSRHVDLGRSEQPGHGLPPCNSPWTPPTSGDFGINTPAYFAMDNLTIAPEPGTLGLAATGLGVAGVGWLWRWRLDGRLAPSLKPETDRD